MQLEAQRFARVGMSPYGAYWRLDLQHRGVREWGWNDLWVRTSITALTGDYRVADDQPMNGTYLRGVFGRAAFVPRIARLGIDYRHSLTRDLVRLGLYHDLVVYQESHYAPRPRLRVGNSFGPGAHFLILNTLQLDAYLSVGFLSDGRAAMGGTAMLEKAF